MNSLPLLETERLILRPLTLADAPALFEACRDPRLTRFMLFETHDSIADSLRFLNESAFPNYAAGWPDPFGIARKNEPERIIGCSGANWTHGHKVMECGYWIAVPEWGRGIATEALGRLIEYVFAATDAERIQARVLVGNEASDRVLLKLGFQIEETRENIVRRRDRYWDTKMFRLLRGECSGYAPVTEDCNPTQG